MADSSNPETPAILQPQSLMLQTIPEDQSVSAQSQRAVSTASAVASVADEVEVTRTSSRWWSPGPSGPGPSSVSGVSETRADLAGGAADPEAPSEPSSRQQNAVQEKSRRRRNYMFFGLIIVVLAAVAIGVYFVVEARDNDNGTPPSTMEPESAAPSTAVPAPSPVPVPAPSLPPFDINIDSDMPSLAPSLNPSYTDAIEDELVKISSQDDLDNPSTIQNKCYTWITKEDKVTAEGIDVHRVSQRYILCLLYESTNGPLGWTVDFLDPNLEECDWTGVGCDGFNVSVVQLQNVNMTGPIPEEFYSLSSLVAISLRSNAISGQLPSTMFEQLPNLSWCDFANNNLNGFIPGPPPNASTIRVLLLYNNDFAGMAPFFPESEEIWIQRNALTDFDHRYATSPTLFKLVMYENSMTGELPDFSGADNLIQLDLAFNNFSGPIPPSIWDLPNLKLLYLHDNEFDGPITGGGEGIAIEKCWLHNNFLNGTLPTRWAIGWTNLISMRLENNYLDGVIDMDQCAAWPQLAQLESDCNPDLGGQVDCACCTDCHGGRQESMGIPFLRDRSNREEGPSVDFLHRGQ